MTSKFFIKIAGNVSRGWAAITIRRGLAHPGLPLLGPGFALLCPQPVPAASAGGGFTGRWRRDHLPAGPGRPRAHSRRQSGRRRAGVSQFEVILVRVFGPNVLFGRFCTFLYMYFVFFAVAFTATAAEWTDENRSATVCTLYNTEYRVYNVMYA